ncbi:MAG: RDD family protein [Thermoleophilaceae bacterium]|nr:RDD family protein [Thermoleophilaceae bacterium]
MSLAAERPASVRVQERAETVQEDVRYEGLVTRAIAFAIDAAVIDIVAIAVAGAVALAVSVLSIPDVVDTVLLAIGGALFVVWSCGYFVTFWSTTGQTPGARVMRLRVVRAGGGRLSAGRALLRVVYLTLAAIPLLLGFAPVLVDERRRGLHDMLAGTVVVEVPEVTPAARRGEPPGVPPS